LGFFEDPALGDFLAVYDEGYDEGMVRTFPSDVAQGAKGFAFGWSDPIPAYNWTDDGSSYVEFHGGLAPTFDASVTLPAGSHLQWTETWYPVAGIGGLRYANDLVALNLEAGEGEVQVWLAANRAWSGELVLLLNGQEVLRHGISLVPGQPFRGSLSLGEDAPQTGQLTVQLEDPAGTTQAVYSADVRLK
jgi:hypothetical protein